MPFASQHAKICGQKIHTFDKQAGHAHKPFLGHDYYSQ